MQSQKNDANQSDERKRRQIMGTLLSLMSPPRIHLCHICKECFPSIRALVGHQNAHRAQQTQLNKMHQQRKLLERGRKKDTSSTKRARNNVYNTDAGNDEIDSELRLGSYPAPKMKVMSFYDFLGTVKEGKGGYGGVDAPSGSGVNKKINDADQHADEEDGANGVGGESEPIAAAADAEYERVFCGGSDHTTGLDLTLTLKL